MKLLLAFLLGALIAATALAAPIDNFQWLGKRYTAASAGVEFDTGDVVISAREGTVKIPWAKTPFSIRTKLAAERATYERDAHIYARNADPNAPIKIGGRVLQVTETGVLFSSFSGLTPIARIHITGITGVVDNQELYGITVIPAAIYQYTDTAGARRTIPGYKLAPGSTVAK